VRLYDAVSKCRGCGDEPDVPANEAATSTTPSPPRLGSYHAAWEMLTTSLRFGQMYHVCLKNIEEDGPGAFLPDDVGPLLRSA
jgi:hypothetical protein